MRSGARGTTGDGVASDLQGPKHGVCTSRQREGWLLTGWLQQVYVWSCRSMERVTGRGGDILWRRVRVGRDPYSRLVPKSCRKKVKI